MKLPVVAMAPAARGRAAMLLLLGSLLLMQPAASVELRMGRMRSQVEAAAATESPDTLVQKMEFEQRLLVCNAYPSDSTLHVTKNSGEVLVDDDHKLEYGQCRYVPTHVAAQDKLDFALENDGVHGSFEVGNLPAADAVLLLVLEKRASGSAVVSFKSFAFPTERDPSSNEAQLAVIDAFRGNSSAPHLKMEDHINDKPKATMSKRVEQLSFDRVYAIEEGVYDASVLEHLQQANTTVKRVLKLVKGQNYVLLRTGDTDSHKPQALVVYPNADAHSAAHRGSILPTLLMSLMALASVALC